MNALRKTVLLALLAAAAPLPAAEYIVKSNGSAGDPNTSDTTCSSVAPANADTCTLRAAIEQASSKAGPHTIKFDPSVTKVTLASGLPQISAPVTIDGTSANPATGGRVEIDGNLTSGCFNFVDVTTAVNAKGAAGSTIKNLVIRRCQGNGITLSGHGYKVLGNRIGLNPAGSSGSSVSDANGGHGISISGTITPPSVPPNLQSLLATLPQGFAGVQALQASLQAALTIIANPNTIAGNVVSGNMGLGIDIFGQGTVNTIVAGNIVGLSQDGLSAVPNGRGPGGAANRAGIRISGTAWGNFIGPGNIVSGNLGHGISLDPGSVLLPNFVAGNLVGLGSAPGVDVGNAEAGIEVDTVPKPAPNPNPTGISAIIGPANTISDNKGSAPTSDLDVMNGDTSGGLVIDSLATNTRVFANVIGLATIPAGSTPLGQLNFGNSGNGINLNGRNHEIRNNLILANGRHGIAVRTSNAYANRIVGNYIGVSVPTGLSPLVGLGNIGDGIHVFNASSNFIGGPGQMDANVIAGNRRHGIAMRGGSNTWSNLVTRNRIFGNGQGGSGIGIDLEHPVNGPDGLNDLDNPSINYAQMDQHRPAICGGAGAPPVCAGAQGPSFDGGGGGTALQWTVDNRPNTNLRIEFFATSATDSVYLGERAVATDGNGLPTGAGCSNGVCSASVGGSTDTTGMGIVATSTDLFPTDVPPTGDQPAPNPNSPANNTSEFSDAAVATRKLEITTAPPLAGGMTGSPYSVQFAATGGTGTYTSWTIAGGAAPTGTNLGAGTGLLSGTPTVANTFTFTVQVTDSGNATAAKAFSITIAATPPLVITTASPLPAGTVDTAYGPVNFTASGGNGAAGNWQIQNGSLPAGLTLATNGALSGTATEVGTFEFNVSTTDQQPTTVIKPFTLTIAPAPVPLAITNATPLPNATQNANYQATFDATGGSGVYVNWAVSAGTAPPGLVLDAMSGALSGKPTTPGTYDFTVRVTDDANVQATKAFALTVLAAPPPPEQPVFTASPADIDFGEVNVGRTAIANVRLTNTGTEGTITPRLTNPPAGSGFTVDLGNCDTVAPLDPGEFCTMMVAFTPTRGGGTPFSSASSVCRNVFQNRCAILIIGGPPNLLARLTYRGVGSGTLAQVSPSRIDFGTQLIQSSGGTLTQVAVDIRNPTDGTLTFDPTPQLSNTAGFSVVNTSCGIGSLGAGLSCQLTFRFLPTVIGETESSTRITLTGAVASESYDIELAGTGVNTAQPTFTAPMTLDFGMVDVGNSESIPVVSRNASGVSLTIAPATFVQPDSLVWSRASAGCPTPTANAGTCSYNYTFRPRAPGPYSIATQLNVTGPGVSQAVPLALSGTGVGNLVEVSPTKFDFGTVNIGRQGRGVATIVNTSLDALDRTFLEPSPFLDSTTCPATIAAGASCTITYTLTPDGDPVGVGPVASQAVLLFSNAVTGNEAVVTIDLSALVVDALFSDGFE